ncbi:hypothetical protein C1I97_28135 [Streptomyces sp. NTH33]|nr:hypothetical protein C1I97_28135 [Streptomyces sp. NTH33]
MFGDPEVDGELGDGRAVRGEPREGEAVRGPQPFEAARDDTAVNALGELTGDGEEIFHLLDGELLITVDGRADRITAGDTVIINAGTTFAVENPTERTAVSWVATSVGLRAELADGTVIAPPWAD